MRDALDPDLIVAVVTAALPVRGTVAALPGVAGLRLRVTGRTNRALASRALTGAGYRLVLLNEAAGTLHVPNGKAEQ